MAHEKDSLGGWALCTCHTPSTPAPQGFADLSAASFSFHSHRIQNGWSPHITFMPLNMPERAKIKINGRKRSCKIPLTEPFN